MTKIEITKRIDAPAHEVFARATDFENAAAAIEGITKIEMLTDGPVGVGTRFRETRILFKRECTETMEVTEFEPPRRYVLGAGGCGCEYRTEMRCDAQGPNATDLTMKFEARPLTFMGKIMSFVFRPMMKKMVKLCAKDLDDLKQSIEGGAPPPSSSARSQSA